jgi:hypothetical protein
MTQNMKKRCTTTVIPCLLIALIALIGCTQKQLTNTGSPKGPAQTGTPSATRENNYIGKANALNVNVDDYTHYCDFLIDPDGEIVSVAVAGNQGKLKKIVLKNETANAAIAEYIIPDTENSTVDMRYFEWSGADSVAVVRKNEIQQNMVIEGVSISKSDETYKDEIYIFDAELSPLSSFPISDELKLDAVTVSYCALGEGELLIAADNNFFVFDHARNEVRQIGAPVTEQLTDISIEGIGAGADKKVAYYGYELDNEKETVYGVISFEANFAEVNRTANPRIQGLSVESNTACFFDSEIPLTGQSSGKVPCLDLKSGKSLDLGVDNLESTVGRLTFDGKYLATGAFIGDVEGNGSWRFRIYNVRTGEAIWESTENQALTNPKSEIHLMEHIATGTGNHAIIFYVIGGNGKGTIYSYGLDGVLP